MGDISRYGLRTAFAASAAGVLGLAGAASAQDVYWNQPVGGAFNVPEHWLPVGVPGASEIANFNLPQEGYQVGFQQPQMNLRLRVRQGHPIFNLGGQTYSVTDGSPGQFSVIVGTSAGMTGRLTLAGGTLQAQRSIIGHLADSTGIVDVGAGTFWNTAQLYVGRDGDGTLNITGGGSVTSTGVSVIGDQTTARGHVLVSGGGSTWQLSALDIAVSGHGTMEILDGGVVRSVDGFLAPFGGATGAVTVAGEGSAWEMTGPLQWGTGAVEILDGGRVVAESGYGRGSMSILGGGRLDILNNIVSSGDGVMLLEGAGSMLDAGGFVLVENTSSLQTVNGAGGSSNGLVIRSNASMVLQESSWTVGELPGGEGESLVLRNSAVLTVSNGQLESVNRSYIDSSLAIEGPQAHWQAELIYIGEETAGSVVLSNGASARGVGTWIGSGVSGHLELQGAETFWDELFVTSVGGSGDGTMVISGGAGMFTGAYAEVGLSGNAGVSGTVVLSGPGSSWEIGGDLQVGSLSAGPTSSGLVSIEGGAALTVETQFYIHATGTVQFHGGTLDADEASVWGSLLLSEGADKVVNFNTLAVDHAAGGRIDLADNAMLIRQGELAAVHELVEIGRAGGDWSGNGITSSTAAEDGQYALGVGLADGGGVRVQFTYAGDATLDGSVTIADLGVLAANWQQADRYWLHGDFNYDGAVNIADLGILAANWQKGVASGSTMDFEEALAMIDVFNGVVVPETSVGMLILAGAGMLRRRHRR
jgi:T5SS/PEP-CTERM-associated repeat protein